MCLCRQPLCVYEVQAEAIPMKAHQWCSALPSSGLAEPRPAMSFCWMDDSLL